MEELHHFYSLSATILFYFFLFLSAFFLKFIVIAAHNHPVFFYPVFVKHFGVLLLHDRCYINKAIIVIRKCIES